MSHIIEQKTTVRELPMLKRACERLGLAAPTHGVHALYGGQTVPGWAVRLPSWRFPVVFQTVVGDVGKLSGEIRYDNYGGCWGDLAHMNELLATYAECVVLSEAEISGAVLLDRTEEANGDIVLLLEVVA